MNEAMLIFVSPYFQFCLRAEAVMAARFSFVIEGITETLEWFQKECKEGSCMQSSQFWFDLKLGR